jgi:hypothetical protein
MSNNKEFQKLFEKFLSADISPTESDQLDEYVRKYPEFKELMRLHQKLSDVEFPVSDPDPALLGKLRADVMRKIRLNKQKSPGVFEEFIDKIRGFAIRPEMAVAALTLMIGFLLGRALPPDKENLTSDLIDQISSLATENIKLEDVQNSPIVYSNVRYQDLDNDMVAINLDATTHLDFIRKKDDPLVHEVMAQTLLSSSNVGAELKAISYTKGVVDPKLKEALIFSLHKTPILPIRIKAMYSLMEYKNDKTIQNAFLKVLQEEESVKMRLLAIEYLMTDQVPPDVLQQTLDESKVTQSPAVHIKMRRYLEKK